MSKPLLVYALHSGNLYGTEQMALATLIGLREHYQPLLLTPQGRVTVEARRVDIPVLVFDGMLSLSQQVRTIFHQYQELIFISTSIRHVLVSWLWQRIYRRNLVQIHAVHGGTTEAKSYGRKHWLHWLGVHLVANSDYVRNRLQHYGVRKQDISVIENFFLPRITVPKRIAYDDITPRRQIIIISRLDPIKRIDLLLDALDTEPRLHNFTFRIFGTGSDARALIARAQEANHMNVHFMGFSEDIYNHLAQADILLHLCPIEPFGLVILEAMAVGVVTLVPNTGGTANIIEDRVSGFHFTANDSADLNRQLLWLANEVSATTFNEVVATAQQHLAQRFSAQRNIAAYQRLLEQQWQKILHHNFQ